MAGGAAGGASAADLGGAEAVRVACIEPGWCTCFRSRLNNTTLSHPARKSLSHAARKSQAVAEDTEALRLVVSILRRRQEEQAEAAAAAAAGGDTPGGLLYELSYRDVASLQVCCGCTTAVSPQPFSHADDGTDEARHTFATWWDVGAACCVTNRLCRGQSHQRT